MAGEAVGSAAVQGEPDLSEKNPCIHPFGLSAPAWFMRKGQINEYKYEIS